MLLNNKLFPTFVIGSLPRERYILKILELINSGRIDEVNSEKILDKAVRRAIAIQEKAGLDFVSDGELRRNSYLRVFVDAVDGFELDKLPPTRFSTSSLPTIVSKIQQKHSLSIKAASFLKKSAKVGTIATIPSPYTIAGKLWSKKHSSKAYVDPGEAMEACIKITNREIKLLAAIGIDVIQLDEPWLGDVPNPEYRESQGILDIGRELEMYVRSVNGAVKGVKGTSLSVHVCGHTSPTTVGNQNWPYKHLMEALGQMNVDRITIAMAGSNISGFKVLENFPNGKLIGLGVLRTKDPNSQTIKEVVERVEKAMEYIPQELITINPECGFAPSKRNIHDLNEVYTLLKYLCEAAEILRNKYA